MEKIINIYCDESCHLENDGHNSMILGCVIIEKRFVKDVSEQIKKIKEKWGCRRFTEIKWTKISPSKIDLYLDIVNLFLKDPHIRFRGVLIPNKTKLSHSLYNQTNDIFYYKMFYVTLKPFIDGNSKFNVYFDIKDKYEIAKVRTIKECIINKNHYDTNNIMFQLIRSYESQLIQLADILIGAMSYKTSGNYRSYAKKAVIDKLEKGLKINISNTTPIKYSKFNILKWIPNYEKGNKWI